MNKSCSNCLYPMSNHCNLCDCARRRASLDQQPYYQGQTAATYTPIMNPVQTNDVYAESGVTLHGEMLYCKVK